MKKLLIPLLVACLIVPCMFMMTGCSGLGLTPVETLNGKDGANGLSPHIGTNGNWWIGETDTGITALGVDGQNGLTPYIGTNLMWWIGNHDTGILAYGRDGNNGLTPYIGADGYWWIGEIRTGHYAIGRTPYPAMSDSGSMTWWIDGVDTGMVAIGKDAPIPHIYNGNWWIGSIDTGFRAIGQDGKDGANGITPHIGSNGNWWYGDLDTGWTALGQNGKNGADGKDGTDGLTPFIHNGTWWIGAYDTGIVADFGLVLAQIELLQNYINELSQRLLFLDSLLSPTPVSFALDSWNTISKVSASGLAQNIYNIGDEKTIMLQDGEIITVVILGFNHDNLSSGMGKAGISLGMKNILTDGTVANETNINDGGWADSYMRNVALVNVFDRLPVELQNLIKTVNKTSTVGNQSTNTVVTADKIWLLSRVELDGTTLDGYVDEGTQYEYWSTRNTNADREKRKPDGQMVNGSWRLRSASTNTANSFIIINGNGSFNINASALPNLGISFGFCI